MFELKNNNFLFKNKWGKSVQNKRVHFGYDLDTLNLKAWGGNPKGLSKWLNNKWI